MADALLSGECVWRGMTRPDLDKAYNNSEAVSDSSLWLAEWTERSALFRSQRSDYLDLRYGIRERNRLDLFCCGISDAPLLVYIHGGYWQRNSKEMFSCLSAGPLAAGFNVAMIGYTLCPEVSFGELVQEIGTALDWLGCHAAEFRTSSVPTIVSGWSAGAHLAALMLPRADVAGGLLISGVYDLEPCRLNYLNEALRLTSEDVQRYSPLHQLQRTGPLIVTCGSQELPELQRQSKDFAARNRDVGVTFLPLPCDHFSILSQLERANGALVDALCQLRQQIISVGESTG